MPFGDVNTGLSAHGALFEEVELFVTVTGRQQQQQQQQQQHEQQRSTQQLVILKPDILNNNIKNL